jgi:riboflavin kinase/FMN adenylyltransferase
VQIYNRPCPIPKARRGVALGFFDGLHRGHLDLIRTLVHRCAVLGLTSAVLTFPEHPDLILHPEQSFAYVSTLSERLALLAEAGVAEVHLQAFDHAFAGRPPEDFLDGVLTGQLGAEVVVVGQDYRFGVGGSGDTDLLRRWARQSGVDVQVIEHVVMAGEKVSSSLIRSLIRSGDLVRTAGLLGRPYRLEGPVIAGRGLGRRLGFPTANVHLQTGKVCPAHGVYATRVWLDQRAYHAITNIGLRPTVTDGAVEPLIETYLYDTEQPLYGRHLVIEILEMIRPEQRFNSLLQLGNQVRQDLEQVRRYHQNAEQLHEKVRVNGRSLFCLSSSRFAQSVLHLVFSVRAEPRRIACNALLMQILTASCRRYPSRTGLARALDGLYGASLAGHADKCGDIQVLYLSVEALTRWTDGSSPFREACSLLFDLLLDPLLADDAFFDEQTVEVERNNLLMELAARRNDRGKYAYDRAVTIYCGDQIHGIDAEGRAEDLQTISRAELRDAYADLLSTGLTVYLGGSAAAETIELCCQRLQQLPAVNRPDLVPGLQPAPPADPPVSETTEFKTLEQARLVLAYSGLPPYFSHQSSVVMVLNSMLGGDVHSLLFDVIREKMGLAYQVYSLNQRYLSAIFIAAGVAPDSLGQTEAAIREQIACLAENRFDDQLLHRARMMLESAILSIGDDLSAWITTQISGRMNGRCLTRDDMLALLASVTREQVAGLAARLKLTLTYRLTSQVSDKECGHDTEPHQI